jgi:hypothetical protein
MSHIRRISAKRSHEFPLEFHMNRADCLSCAVHCIDGRMRVRTEVVNHWGAVVPLVLDFAD